MYVCMCVSLLSLYIQIDWIPPGFSLSLCNTHSQTCILTSQLLGCGPKLNDVSGKDHIAKSHSVAPMPLLTVSKVLFYGFRA